MKRLLKWGGAILFIGMFLYTCVYNRITHLSDEELKWVTNRQEGETMYFVSQSGVTDTVKVMEVSIRNSLDPINWGIFNTNNKEYIATAHVRYSLSRDRGGILCIEKKHNDKPIYFSSILSERWLYDIPLKTTCLRIGNVCMNDIILFDNAYSGAINQDETEPNTITKYAWSKKYGLVQYSFQDGTVFSRILR